MLLKLADTVLNLVNTGPSNVNVYRIYYVSFHHTNVTCQWWNSQEPPGTRRNCSRIFLLIYFSLKKPCIGKKQRNWRSRFLAIPSCSIFDGPHGTTVQLKIAGIKRFNLTIFVCTRNFPLVAGRIYVVNMQFCQYIIFGRYKKNLPMCTKWMDRISFVVNC